MTVTIASRQSPPSRREPPAQAHPPRRIAVFGSLSAERATRAAVAVPASSARAVLEQVFAEIAARAPLIAGPILDRAVGEGKVTPGERDELLHELADPEATGEVSAATRAGAGSRTVLSAAFSAIRRAAPGIATPILGEAVADGRLTQAQARRILDRLRTSPSAPFRGARGARSAA